MSSPTESWTTAMDYVIDATLPGGDSFVDVTQMLTDAAQDMPPGSLVLAKDFTLQDAMAAFEIGEPRFDSGLALMDQTRPAFDPLQPLLPEEVCWVIDRSFACEMEWHVGYTLSQTIYSFLHVHALRETDPELIPADQSGEVDHTRPPELVTVVLRAYVYGLLKSCDLSWRELNKGHVYDTEDWQSEKCDVPLAEALPVSYVQAKLEHACGWLDRSFQAPSIWKDALRDRLVLRKTLINLFSAQLSKEYHRFRPLVNTARQLIQKIRQAPPPEPKADSPVPRAFDPQFARVLISYIPLHVIGLPDQDIVWNKLVGLLDCLDQLSTLAGVSNLASWKIMGHIQVWLSKPDRRLPYIRSACQSTLFENGLVLNKYTQRHIVECFFAEICGISYDSFIGLIDRRWRSPQSPPLAHLERSIIELELGYIKALWYNPARRRRYCVKSLFDWHTLYALLLEIQGNLEPWLPERDPFRALCAAIMVQRLSVIREVIFSGAQLSLYSSEERVFAYWYATQVIELQLSYMDELAPELQGSAALEERRFQSTFLTALQAMSSAIFSVTLKKLGNSWQRMRLNCVRRYKWAFMDEYEDVYPAPVGHPNFLKFTAACSAIQQDRDYSPAGQIRLAGMLLEELTTFTGGWTGPWVEERKQSIQGLRDVCRTLEVLPESMVEVANTWDVSVLSWDPDVHPWFPFVVSR